MSILSTVAARVPHRNVRAVYATTLLLSVAYGMALALTPMLLEERELPASDIGSLASFFGLGLVALAVPAGRIVRWLTPRWTLAIAMTGYLSTVALFPLMHSYPELAICRFFDGGFSVATWLSFETLLLRYALYEWKAFSTSLYATITGLGYVIGALCARWVLGAEFTTISQSFWLAASFGALAVLMPLLVIRESKADLRNAGVVSQEGEALSATPLRKLAVSIRASSFATFLTGYFQSASVLFMPLFLIHERGLPRQDTALVVALSCFGMLTMANPSGRLGDRFGHLFMMRVLAFMGVLGLIGFLVIPSFPWLGLAIFFGGGSLVAIPPLSLALQGVIVAPSDYERSNSLFNVYFAVGLLLGPLTSGWVYDAFGGRGVISVFALLWSAFIVVSWLLRRDDPRVRRGQMSSSESNAVTAT